MGLLGDIGRSGGVGQLGQGFLTGAMQAGQFAQQAEMNKMQQQLIQAKIAEQERLNRPTLLSELVGKGSEAGKPNMMKIFAEAAKASGAKKITLPGGGEDYTITQADIPTIQKFMALQQDLHPQLTWAQYQDNAQNIPELQKQLAKAKTLPEQIQLKEQIEKLKIENASILKEFGREDKPEKEEEQWESRTVNVGGKDVMIRKNITTGKEEQVTAGPGPMSDQRPYSTFVGATPDGTKGVVFDARKGTFSTQPLPGGELPGVKSMKALPAEEAKVLGQLKTTWQDVNLVRDAWQEGLTGAFQGRANEALQNVRNHPAFETLRRRTNRLITIAYALSGKQISEKEIQILKKSILPQVEQMDQNFLVALNELQDWVKRNSQNAQEAYRKSKYQFEPIDLGASPAPESQKPRFEIIQVK
jgi:hypothetical protein